MAEEGEGVEETSTSSVSSGAFKFGTSASELLWGREGSFAAECSTLCAEAAGARFELGVAVLQFALLPAMAVSSIPNTGITSAYLCCALAANGEKREQTMILQDNYSERKSKR